MLMSTKWATTMQNSGSNAPAPQYVNTTEANTEYNVRCD